MEIENRNWKLETETKTNPMKLMDLISTDYGEKARNKPNGAILNYINILRRFLASFCGNMNEKRVYLPFPIRLILHGINNLRNLTTDFRRICVKCPPSFAQGFNRSIGNNQLRLLFLLFPAQPVPGQKIEKDK